MRKIHCAIKTFHGCYINLQTVAFTLRETSRGHIRLKSADPTQPPVIQPNYLATMNDVVDMRNLVKIGRQVNESSCVNKDRRGLTSRQ
jgi:choline dehydrogenase-like flavoprotein